MALLTLKREEAAFGLLRLLKIKVDLDRVVPLRYKEEKTIELPIGTHTLIAKMSWTKSIPLSVTLADGDHKYILIGCLPLIDACIRSYIPPFEIFTLKEISNLNS